VKAGWNEQKLGEVCDFLNRGTSPRYLDDGGVCVLNQKCVRDHAVSWEQSRRHDAKAKSVSPERFVRLGDVLVNSTGTGTLGRVAQIREEPAERTTVDSHVTIVRPKPGMFHLDFFGYMLAVIEDAIKEAGEGCGGQTELARAILAERFSVTYPTAVPEQRRIVGILDEAFEGIATAKANAEKNLQNARALFESHLQSVFNERSKDWRVVPMSTVLSEQPRNGWSPPLAYQTGSGTPVLTLSSVTGFQYDGARVKLSSAPTREDAHYWLKPNELLITRSNTRELVGHVAIYDGTPERAICCDLIMKMTIDPSMALTRFVYYYLRSPIARAYLTSHAQGANPTMVKIGKQVVQNITVPLPPLARQKTITSLLDSLKEETQRLASIYQQKLDTLGELKKSLLHQAFSGNL